MSFLHLAPQAIAQAGAAWTAEEIAQQPRIWRDLAAAGAGASQAFLAPLLRRPEVQIVLTGAGTSAHIGECLLPALTKRWGTRVRAVATTDLVADPDGCLTSAPLLLVSFARSGNSPESVAALMLAEQISPDCHHLMITCNERGELCRQGGLLRNSHVFTLPEATNDRAFAMTSSFSGMLFSAALAFGLLSSDTATALACWATAVLADFPDHAHLAEKGFNRVVYLGSRALRPLAREAALKILELTDGQVIGVSETPLGFRHGPKTIIDAKTLVVFLLCNEPYTRAYEQDLVNELRNDGVAGRVIALSASDESAPGSPDTLSIAGATGATDLELCFPYAVFAQCLALQASLARGLRPDAPNARGTVNRVVQGVSIYPWTPPA
jgi:tagatose-6-phosphate ketose/aldose isomerase